MSVETEFTNKDKISSVDWIYYRLPENSTCRQILMKQSWKHRPDLSWDSSVGWSDEEPWPPPDFPLGTHCLFNILFTKKRAFPCFKIKVSRFLLILRWTIFLCARKNTKCVPLLIADRRAVWEENHTSHCAENPNKQEDARRHLRCW